MWKEYVVERIVCRPKEVARHKRHIGQKGAFVSVVGVEVAGIVYHRREVINGVITH